MCVRNTSKPEKIYIIYNKYAGSAASFPLDKLSKFLNKYIESEIKAFDNPKDLQKFVDERSIAGELALYVALGGDGTANLLLNALDGRQIMSLLPAGTANVAAIELGFPLGDSQRAAKTILDGALRKIYPGSVNGRKFLFSAGIGQEAHICAKINPLVKAVIGKGAYAVEAVKNFALYTPPILKVVTSEGETFFGEAAIVCKMRYYAGNFILAPEADYRDDFLHAIIIKKYSPSSILKLLRFGAGAGPFPEESAYRLKARSFVVESDIPVYYHADGEVAGVEARFNFSVSPNSQPFIMP